MKKSRATILFSVAALFVWTGCAEREPWEPVETIRSGPYQVEILTPGGTFNNGPNRVAVEVSNNGQPVEVEVARLGFHMPEMGSMRRMDTHAELAGRDGRAEGSIAFEMAGGWYGEIEVTTDAEPIQADFQVQVR